MSRRFVAAKKALDELLGRDLPASNAAVVMMMMMMMMDGVDFAARMCVAALVVTADGTKVPVGLRLGGTENATVIKALLADLPERGLDASGVPMVVIDGAAALDSAVRSVFGSWR